MRKLGMWFAFLLAVVPCYAATAPSDDKATSDLTLVPQDAAGVVTLNVGGLWEDQVLKDMLKAIASSPKSADVLDRAEKMIGINLKKVQRMTVILPLEPEDHTPLLIITTTKALDQDRVRNTLAPEAVKKTVAGEIYFASK